MSGYSGTPLAQKLGIKAGSRLYVHEGPPHYAQLVAPLPAGVRNVTRVDADTDLIHAFVTTRSALAGVLKSTLKAMRADAALWISWPKQSSKRDTDITEDVLRELALPLGLVDIKVCAVDETWSALKLVMRKNARPAPAKRAARPR